jgi:hypothetical protein
VYPPGLVMPVIQVSPPAGDVMPIALGIHPLDYGPEACRRAINLQHDVGTGGPTGRWLAGWRAGWPIGGYGLAQAGLVWHGPYAGAERLNQQTGQGQ